MKTIPLVMFVLLLGRAFAVGPDTLWTRTFGGSGDDLGRSLRLTPDGGCVIAGYTRSFGAGGSDVWLVRTDSLGDTLWTRTYGGALDEDAYAVDATPDGGFIIAGYTRSFGAGGADIWLLKIDAAGDTAWTRTFGDALDDVGYSLAPTKDGGYVVAADQRSTVLPGNPTVASLIRTDSLGDTLWTRSYGSGTHPKTVLVNRDGGYTVAARFVSGGTEYAWLMKADSIGDSVWAQRSGSIGLNDIQLRMDGSYVATGAIPGPAVFWLGALDTLGQELWGRFFADGTARAVRLIDDGGCIATGNAAGDRQDVYLVRTDSTGDSLWSELIGGASNDYGYAVEPLPDHGFLVLGSTQSFGAGRTDAWLVRLGTEVVAVAERRRVVNLRPRAAATVLSCALSAERLASGSLFDAMGRRVLYPRPGVFFVRQASSAMRDASGVTKVVLTR